jgi:hypothetical protein
VSAPLHTDKRALFPPRARTIVTTATDWCASSAIDATGGFFYSARAKLAALPAKWQSPLLHAILPATIYIPKHLHSIRD